YGLGGNGWAVSTGGAVDLKKNCGSDTGVFTFLQQLLIASDKILNERAHVAESRNVAIISHYPDEFMGGRNLRKDYIAAMPADKQVTANVLNFYGHTHIQECRGRDARGKCVDLLTGGSGGCCGTGDVPAGFVVVSWDDAKLQQVECFTKTTENSADCTVYYR
ncbi:unnamed protein product, partial [Polarella glacialis]